MVFAAGFTTSFAPTTSTTSVFLNSGLISSISLSDSYGTFASASSTFMCPGIRPATGWMPKSTSTPRASSAVASSAIVCWPCATASP